MVKDGHGKPMQPNHSSLQPSPGQVGNKNPGPQNPPPPPSVGVNPEKNQFRVQNQSKPRSYVHQSALTTSDKYDVINSKNPFVYDNRSSINFQKITANVPNPDDLKSKTLKSIRRQKQVSESLMKNQKGNESSESLISKMYFQGEHSTRAPILNCQSVAIEKNASDGAPTQYHRGVRGIITNKRLIFVDSTKNSVYTLTKEKLLNKSLVTPFRKDESYKTKATITDDMWYKPIPLNSVTGVEIYTSHKSEASQYVANRVGPQWFISLMIGIIFLFMSFLLSVGQSMQTDSNSEDMFVEIFAIFMFGIVFLSASGFLYNKIARVKMYNSINTVTKSRKILIGAYDNIRNCPVMIRIETEDNQSLTSIFNWCKELQENCPRLSSDSEPLILN